MLVKNTTDFDKEKTFLHQLKNNIDLYSQQKASMMITIK